MGYGRVCVFSTLAVVLALECAARGQSVISTRAGVVHYFEGAVYSGDQLLTVHPGKFPSVPQGGELRTADGRAEVLLTPGAFLRMGERSSIRMVANDLADTQVELERGSAIVDAAEPNPDTSVTLIYKNWRIHAAQEGVYRIDSEPPRLRVLRGEVKVMAAGGQPVTVEQGMSLPFAGVLAPERSGEQPVDALSEWQKGRGESILADNMITAQIDEDPATATAGLDSFTYFPILGMSSPGPVPPDITSPDLPSLPGLYRSAIPSQPGFNSIYLPGYTYRPPLLGLMGRGLRGYGASRPRLAGVSGPGTGPGILVPSPRAPVFIPGPVVHSMPGTIRSGPGPIYSAPGPVHTAPGTIHTAPGVGRAAPPASGGVHIAGPHR